ncbi:hypothetical protein ACLOJK_027612 [Asimina triloba]
MNKDKIFKLAKGFRGRAKNCIRIARERVEKALQYSYRDRRNKKRDMRSLWIERINAGTRLHEDITLLKWMLQVLVVSLVATMCGCGNEQISHCLDQLEEYGVMLSKANSEGKRRRINLRLPHPSWSK